jgi:asparagine synthase (glutamine-hydrolysing)
MSGVFGVVDRRGRVPIDRCLARMGEAMAHRAWYVTETRSDQARGVGLGRIGIGIFNRERQPVYSEDGNVWLFLSGELYHTAEVRRRLQAQGHRFRHESDLELALRLYEARGEAFVHDLQGAFVVGIWDNRRQTLIVANDRYGLYPLHYAHYDGRLVFAPEVKGVLCAPDFRKELDLAALAEYVRFQHLLGDKTFFEGLRLLPNASILRYQPGDDALSLQTYWDFASLPALPASITFDEAVEEAGRRLQAAVNHPAHGGHRLGVYLSGGLDARAILGLLHRDHMPIVTITYGLHNCRDAIYARQMARALGTRHHDFEFSDGRWVEAFADLHLTLTEGFHSWIHSHGISLLPQVRELIDVNLTGFGGGQSAIDWNDPALFAAPDDLAFTSRLFHLLSQETTWPSLTEAEERLLYLPPLFRKVNGLAYDSFHAELTKYQHLPYERRAAYFALCNPDRRLFQYYTVFNRSHVEQRFPFYDYAYLEFVYALPPEMLYQRRLRRALLRRRAPVLARIPYDKDELPVAVSQPIRRIASLLRRTRRYLYRRGLRLFPQHPTLNADYENWLRRELREWGEDLLLGERTLARGLFDRSFLQSLWRRQQSGAEVNIIGKLAPLMTYEMVLRRFYDEPA